MHASTLVNRDWFWDGQTEYIAWFRPKVTSAQLLAAATKAELELIDRVADAGLLPKTERTLQRWVERIGSRGGYPGLCPLTLRHSRAIYLRQNGFNLEETAALMGCSTKVVVKYYARRKDGDLARKAARLVE
jgi:integrase